MPHRLHKQQIIAVLIDAENAQYTLTAKVLQRAACYGQIAIKRAYADWTRDNLRNARKFLQDHGVEAVQTFKLATGKNSADLTMSIEAVHLHSLGHIDAFCLVTSDSDFTPLAFWLRRDGGNVYGMGARHTPRAFVKACSRFVYVEQIGSGAA